MKKLIVILVLVSLLMSPLVISTAGTGGSTGATTNGMVNFDGRMVPSDQLANIFTIRACTGSNSNNCYTITGGSVGVNGPQGASRSGWANDPTVFKQGVDTSVPINNEGESQNWILNSNGDYIYGQILVQDDGQIQIRNAEGAYGDVGDPIEDFGIEHGIQNDGVTSVFGIKSTLWRTGAGDAPRYSRFNGIDGLSTVGTGANQLVILDTSNGQRLISSGATTVPISDQEWDRGVGAILGNGGTIVVEGGATRINAGDVGSVVINDIPSDQRGDGEINRIVTVNTGTGDDTSTTTYSRTAGNFLIIDSSGDDNDQVRSPSGTVINGQHASETGLITNDGIIVGRLKVGTSNNQDSTLFSNPSGDCTEASNCGFGTATISQSDDNGRVVLQVTQEGSNLQSSEGVINSESGYAVVGDTRAGTGDVMTITHSTTFSGDGDDRKGTRTLIVDGRTVAVVEGVSPPGGDSTTPEDYVREGGDRVLIHNSDGSVIMTDGALNPGQMTGILTGNFQQPGATSGEGPQIQGEIYERSYIENFADVDASDMVVRDGRVYVEMDATKRTQTETDLAALTDRLLTDSRASERDPIDTVGSGDGAWTRNSDGTYHQREGDENSALTINTVNNEGVVTETRTIPSQLGYTAPEGHNILSGDNGITTDVSVVTNIDDGPSGTRDGLTVVTYRQTEHGSGGTPHPLTRVAYDSDGRIVGTLSAEGNLLTEVEDLNELGLPSQISPVMVAGYRDQAEAIGEGGISAAPPVPDDSAAVQSFQTALQTEMTAQSNRNAQRWTRCTSDCTSREGVTLEDGVETPESFLDRMVDERAGMGVEQPTINVVPHPAVDGVLEIPPSDGESQLTRLIIPPGSTTGTGDNLKLSEDTTVYARNTDGSRGAVVGTVNAEGQIVPIPVEGGEARDPIVVASTAIISPGSAEAPDTHTINIQPRSGEGDPQTVEFEQSSIDNTGSEPRLRAGAKVTVDGEIGVVNSQGQILTVPEEGAAGSRPTVTIHGVSSGEGDTTPVTAITPGMPAGDDPGATDSGGTITIPGSNGDDAQTLNFAYGSTTGEGDGTTLKAGTILNDASGQPVALVNADGQIAYLGDSGLAGDLDNTVNHARALSDGASPQEIEICAGKSETECRALISSIDDAQESNERATAAAARGEGPAEWRKDLKLGLKKAVAYANQFGKGKPLSNLLFGEIYAQELTADIDRWFSSTVLSQDYYESLVCAGVYPDVQTSGASIIETPSGTFQSVATIQADRSRIGPILCESNSEGEDYCAEEGLECEDDGFCYNSAGEIAEGGLYKITWGVSAPANEQATPYLDENGIAVTYNIVICKTGQEVPTYADPCPDEVRIYNYLGDNTYPLKLENGEKDGASFIQWSSNDYDTACIDWGNPPITQGGRGTGAAASVNFIGSGGVDLPDNCVNIKGTLNDDYGPGTVQVDSTSGTAGTTSESMTTVTSGDGDIATSRI